MSRLSQLRRCFLAVLPWTSGEAGRPGSALPGRIPRGGAAGGPLAEAAVTPFAVKKNCRSGWIAWRKMFLLERFLLLLNNSAIHDRPPGDYHRLGAHGPPGAGVQTDHGSFRRLLGEVYSRCQRCKRALVPTMVNSLCTRWAAPSFRSSWRGMRPTSLSRPTLKLSRSSVVWSRTAQGSWLGHVSRFLQTLGWHQPDARCPHTWHHDGMGISARQTWRHLKYVAFLNSNRRDAPPLRHVPSDRKRVQKTRVLFQGGDVHRSAVLCGAAHFPRHITRSGLMAKLPHVFGARAQGVGTFDVVLRGVQQSAHASL